MKPKRHRNSLAGTFFLAILGTGALAFGLRVAYLQHAMQDWPRAEATIIRFDNGIKSGGPGPDAWYANPEIEYEYRVDGTRFTSTGLNPSPFNYQDPEELREDTSAFSQGARVTCWYDPDTPSRSYVLNSGITLGPVLCVALGGIAILPFVVLLLTRCVRAAIKPDQSNATP